jgi:hypothetical protein
MPRLDASYKKRPDVAQIAARTGNLARANMLTALMNRQALCLALIVSVVGDAFGMRAVTLVRFAKQRRR